MRGENQKETVEKARQKRYRGLPLRAAVSDSSWKKGKAIYIRRRKTRGQEEQESKRRGALSHSMSAGLKSSQGRRRHYKLRHQPTLECLPRREIKRNKEWMGEKGSIQSMEGGREVGGGISVRFGTRTQSPKRRKKKGENENQPSKPCAKHRRTRGGRRSWVVQLRGKGGEERGFPSLLKKRDRRKTNQ